MEMVQYFFIGAVSGLIAAILMNLAMRRISATYSEEFDMTVSLGSFFTGRLENARKAGIIIHVFAGALFGGIYYAAFYFMGLTKAPASIFVGLGFGFIHGLCMSYVLMLYASERHPIEKYRNATFSTGVIHLIGHMIFGVIVGVLGGTLAAVI